MCYCGRAISTDARGPKRPEDPKANIVQTVDASLVALFQRVMEFAGALNVQIVIDSTKKKNFFLTYLFNVRYHLTSACCVLLITPCRHRPVLCLTPHQKVFGVSLISVLNALAASQNIRFWDFTAHTPWRLFCWFRPEFQSFLSRPRVIDTFKKFALSWNLPFREITQQQTLK